MQTADMPASEPLPCPRHPGTETRLRCTECDSPICPQCMVMYEVGFKCPACAKKRPSHMQQVGVRHHLIGGLGALLSGFAYGWAFPWLTLTFGMMGIFGVPVLCWLLSYVLGQSTGRLLQRLLHYKYHTGLSAIIFLLAVAGLLLSPFQSALQAAWDMVSSAISTGGTSIELFLLGGGLQLASVGFFLRGLLQPFRGPR